MEQSLTGRFPSWRCAAAPPMLECVPSLTQPRPGVPHARPAQAPPPRRADRRLARGPRSPGPLLPPPGGEARPRLRPRLDAGALCRPRPALHRPGRLLQAAAGHVLRGHPLRAPAHRDRQPQPGPPLVPRLRPRRGAARSLQPDPHPPAAGDRRLPALLRAGRRPVPGGGARLGPGALLRCDPGAGRCRHRLARAALLSRGQDPRRRRVRRLQPEPTERANERLTDDGLLHLPAARPEIRDVLRRSRTRRDGTCWRSGGSTRRGRPIAATGARATSGSARPTRMPPRCGPPARLASATTTTTSSMAASAGSSWPPW